MKAIIFVLILLVPATTFGGVWNLSGVPQDKVMHFAGSFIINTGIYAACYKLLGKEKENTCFWSSLAATLAIGIAKEVHDGDNNTTKEHSLDLTADGLGALSSGITLRFTF